MGRQSVANLSNVAACSCSEPEGRDAVRASHGIDARSRRLATPEVVGIAAKSRATAQEKIFMVESIAQIQNIWIHQESEVENSAGSAYRNPHPARNLVVNKI